MPSFQSDRSALIHIGNLFAYICYTTIALSLWLALTFIFIFIVASNIANSKWENEEKEENISRARKGEKERKSEVNRETIKRINHFKLLDFQICECDNFHNEWKYTICVIYLKYIFPTSSVTSSTISFAKLLNDPIKSSD